jgi:hypothetical protein
MPGGVVHIKPLPFVGGDTAVFVSGMQGLLVVMSTEEVFDPIRCESKQMPVYMLAELATPLDTWLKKAALEN